MTMEHTIPQDKAVEKALKYSQLHRLADEKDDAGGPDQGQDLRTQAQEISDELQADGWDVLDLLNLQEPDDSDEDDEF